VRAAPPAIYVVITRFMIVATAHSRSLFWLVLHAPAVLPVALWITDSAVYAHIAVIPVCCAVLTLPGWFVIHLRITLHLRLVFPVHTLLRTPGSLLPYRLPHHLPFIWFLHLFVIPGSHYVYRVVRFAVCRCGCIPLRVTACAHAHYVHAWVYAFTRLFCSRYTVALYLSRITVGSPLPAFSHGCSSRYRLRNTFTLHLFPRYHVTVHLFSLYFAHALLPLLDTRFVCPSCAVFVILFSIRYVPYITVLDSFTTAAFATFTLPFSTRITLTLHTYRATRWTRTVATARPRSVSHASYCLPALPYTLPLLTRSRSYLRAFRFC